MVSFKAAQFSDRAEEPKLKLERIGVGKKLLNWS